MNNKLIKNKYGYNIIEKIDKNRLYKKLNIGSYFKTFSDWEKSIEKFDIKRGEGILVASTSIHDILILGEDAKCYSYYGSFTNDDDIVIITESGEIYYIYGELVEVNKHELLHFYDESVDDLRDEWKKSCKDILKDVKKYGIKHMIVCWS